MPRMVLVDRSELESLMQRYGFTIRTYLPWWGKIVERRQQKLDVYYTEVAPILIRLFERRQTEKLQYFEIAQILNRDHVPTPYGKGTWHITVVARLYHRYIKNKDNPKWYVTTGD